MKEILDNTLFRFSSFASLRFCAFALIIFFAISIQAQSTDQSFPTAITSNQISGTIKARDIGDSRLTTYFYLFNGEQGDIFVNVVTKNFDGDIDVFTVDGLKPLTKIRVFSDSSDNETGRIIYLRQPEKLILRVEGRSPNDEPATFQIKFAGSFVAEKASNEKNDAPQVKNESQSDVRVNSVGTIIEVKPKPTPKPIETATKTEKVIKKEEKTAKTKVEKAEVVEKKEETQEIVKKVEEQSIETIEEKPTLEVVVTDNLEKPTEVKTEVKAETKVEEKTEETPKTETKTEKEANPLEKIKLTIIFKDGKKLERPMSEILNVNVDKGILTIIEKDGTIGRYSILDIEEFTIK